MTTIAKSLFHYVNVHMCEYKYLLNCQLEPHAHQNEKQVLTLYLLESKHSRLYCFYEQDINLGLKKKKKTRSKTGTYKVVP